MSDVPFHRTRMGMRFYEATVPALVDELKRLNNNLEKLFARWDASEPPALSRETEPKGAP